MSALTNERFVRPYPDSIREHQEHEERREKAMARHQARLDADFEWNDYPPCPNCGECGQPISFDFGRDSETGYDDSGAGCTHCMRRFGC